MADSRKYNLGGNCAIAAAVGYIIVGITFFSLPLIQRGSQGRLQITEYFNSVASFKLWLCWVLVSDYKLFG